MHNVVKWPNILLKYCGVNTARFLKYVWPFYNIMHERVKENGTLLILDSIRIKNVDTLVVGNLSINSLDPKFDELKALVAGKVDILLVTKKNLRRLFPFVYFL